MAMHVGVRMEHRLSPTQLLVSELLPLPVVDLAARLEAELAANPALELAERPSCPGCGRVVWRGRCRCRGVLDHTPSRLDVAAPRSARDDVLHDVAPSMPADDRRIAVHLVSDVDRYGVLDEPWESIARRLGVGTADVCRVVAAMRRAGHPGLCAPSLAHRLRLEAAAADDGTLPPEVNAVLSRAGAATRAEVEVARRWLRGRVRLEPFEPDDEAVPPPLPVDLVVRSGGHGLRAEVVAGPWSALGVAESYVAHAAEPSVRTEMAGAERFVAALGRREQLVQRVGEAVVSRQADSLVDRSRACRALTRREVAADLGVHESTVSRAVAGKHVALPNRDVVPLATMFGSGAEVHDALREIVRDETSAMSDTALARALAGRGHVVARRTVAKYRAVLGIPDRGRRQMSGSRR